jgi:hypothetical protein
VASRVNPIDRTMERASKALEKTDYFLAERLALDALRRAHDAGDYQRMSRIVLPLQEARRQKRQLATDHAGAAALIIADARFLDADPPLAGCFLFQPPLIGADGRTYRETADAAEVPAFILTREPMTRDGLWPVVAVGAIALRTKVPPPSDPAPPWPARRLETGMTRDDVRPETHTIPIAWFESAAEALGDAAIARLQPADPAAWQVADLMEFLEAHPDHEKLHQRLEEACNRAIHETAPEGVRRRPVNDDPYGF